MVTKNYPPESETDAVALYESRPDATIRSVAADLGINPETLRNCVRAAGASRPRGRRNRPSRRPSAAESFRQNSPPRPGPNSIRIPSITCR
ncbi:transposase [Streptomyces longisporoflavus]|uniref:Transposase n=1 Tax=Streptomyces longisporoflavus TaxID=28044 RepID=A0ABW7R0D3_9ACTN